MSQHLYAMHDPGDWFNYVHDAGKTAWCVHTEAIGCDPNDRSGKDYRHPFITPVVRINNGYGKGIGTIPAPERHSDFARRGANFVAASPGLRYVVVGNEIGMEWEQWGDNPITLDEYCAAYIKFYMAVKPINPELKLAPQAPAPWNARVPDAPDWIDQLAKMLTMLNGYVDFIALHAYTRDYSHGSFSSGAKMDPPWQHRSKSWETLAEYMAAIPSTQRKLPVLITETNGNQPWPADDSGWISRLYNRIDSWNKAGNQRILCAALFRWNPQDPQWDISTKSGSLADFQRALYADYRHDFAAKDTTFPAFAHVSASAGLNLREQPSGKVLGVLNYGTPLTIHGRDGQWLQVTADASSGWVHQNYITYDEA